jgi:mono/diheme cytochrome c family protein
MRGIKLTISIAMLMLVVLSSIGRADLFRLERKAESGREFHLDSLHASDAKAKLKAKYLKSLGYETRVKEVRSNAQRAAEGELLYKANCASCHRRDGRGEPGLFPPLAGSEWVGLPPARP